MGKRVRLREKVRKSVHSSDKDNKMDVANNTTSLIHKFPINTDFVKRNKSKLLTKRDKKHIKKRVWDDRLKRAAKRTTHKKQIKKKVKSTPLFHNLDTLFQAIQEIETENTNSAPKSRSIKVLTSKRRKKMLALESERFRKVQQHPSFKADPIGTITEHLRNEMK
ncbi:Ribosome biogenesis protein slx9-like [Oopsacas minuta]|uniref:Ribosome biogenesis protein slx9-like n=1 Tax=Oopsacas minuta TaxID=111878 RepID=A0AAV7JLZ3_9METZ|nr:Ribosome biogenesis protein slx9-like [Oopsacas minuta]